MVHATPASQVPHPLSDADISAVRRHPGFRAAVEAYAAANLARYHALGLVERWMVSDMGRASLSGAVVVLDALGRLTPATLMASQPVARGEVSRGRARLYLQRAVANGLIDPAERGAPLRGDTALSPTPRFQAVMTGILKVALEAAATLAPEVAPALGEIGRQEFVRRFAAHVGAITASRPDLFPLASPVQLFQARDGGTRLLEGLVVRQSPGRERLLLSCAYSHSALARASRCSRAHVIQLLQEGQARGFLRLNGRALTIAPELSDDAERYFATHFATARTATTRALAEA